jgi:HEAT repeat protein
MKWKIGLVLTGAAVTLGAFWLWPSQEPAYEGKRLGQWLDEGVRLAPTPYVTNQPVGRVVKAVQAIGTNAITFLLRDLERNESHWLGRAKDRACRLKLMDETHLRSWRVTRSLWGFEALGTNAAHALERLLALLDNDGNPSGGVQAALIALGPVAVPDLVMRLRSTNWMTSERAAFTLQYMGGSAVDSAIPLLLEMLGETNTTGRQYAVGALTGINRQPERLVPVFRNLLGDSNGVIRSYAVYGLSRFGPSAREAVPDLLRAANDSDPDVSNAVRRALEQIESEASKAASR